MRPIRTDSHTIFEPNLRTDSHTMDSRCTTVHPFGECTTVHPFGECTAVHLFGECTTVHPFGECTTVHLFGSLGVMGGFFVLGGLRALELKKPGGLLHNKHILNQMSYLNHLVIGFHLPEVTQYYKVLPNPP